MLPEGEMLEPFDQVRLETGIVPHASGDLRGREVSKSAMKKHASLVDEKVNMVLHDHLVTRSHVQCQGHG